MTNTFTFTQEQLTKILPHNKQIPQWHKALLDNFPKYEINTKLRVAAFLAQCAHESLDFTVLRENLNYRATSLVAVWPRRFNAQTAPAYEKQPEKIANFVYASRMGNGDEKSGDGFKYRGRGLIQLTGRSNYTACSKAMYGDLRLVDNPDLVATDPDAAIKSACWFWSKNNLNSFADASDITGLTKKINGGVVGIDARKAHYENFLKVLGA